MNNPMLSIHEFFERLQMKSVYARCQLEKGEQGTHHFQACVGYDKNVRHAKMTKDFPKCHIEKGKSAMALWNYCGKEETRDPQEPCLSHGLPPASKNVKGDTKKRNAMILEYGVVKAVEEGLVPLEKFKQVK